MVQRKFLLPSYETLQHGKKEMLTIFYLKMESSIAMYPNWTKHCDEKKK
jgi:hypothetical protein